MAERQLQTPHGGELVNLMAPASEHAALKDACTKSIELSDRNACDVELLTVGCGLDRHGGVLSCVTTTAGIPPTASFSARMQLQGSRNACRALL